MPDGIKKIVNHDDFNLWFMAVTGAIVAMLNSMESPSFIKTIYSTIPQKLVSVQSFCCCAATIVVCLLWTHCFKVRKFIMKHYLILALTGMIFSVAIDATTLINVDQPWMVYILVIGNTICFDVLLGEWFNRGWSFLKAALFETTNARNKYDTTTDMVDSISMLVGFGIGIFIDVPIKAALSLSIVGGIVWGIKHVVIFLVNKGRILDKVDKSNEEESSEN